MRSSSATIIQNLSSIDQFPSTPSISIPLQIKPVLKNEIAKFKNTYALSNKKLFDTLIFSEENITINDLTNCYRSLCLLENNQFINEQDKLIIEKYKLAIIKSVASYLDQFELYKKEVIEKELANTKWKFLKLMLFSFLSVSGLLMNASWNILGTQQLLTLIPGISNPLSIMISIFLSGINSLLFLAFDAALLRNALGVSSFSKASKNLFDLQEKEIKGIKRVNHLLANYHVISQIPSNEYRQCAEIAKVFNKDIAQKKHKYHYQEKPANRLFRYLVTGLGSIMIVAGSYFGMNSLLGLVAAPLIGTPVGWAIIGVATISSLGFYFSTRANSMYAMTNPTFKKYEKVKMNLDKFNVKTDGEFDNIYANKLQNPTNTHPSTVGAKPSATFNVDANVKEKLFCDNSTQTNLENDEQRLLRP